MVSLVQPQPAPSTDALAAEVAYLRGQLAAIERSLLAAVAYSTGQPAAPVAQPSPLERAAAAWHLPPGAA